MVLWRYLIPLNTVCPECCLTVLAEMANVISLAIGSAPRFVHVFRVGTSIEFVVIGLGKSGELELFQSVFGDEVHRPLVGSVVQSNKNSLKWICHFVPPTSNR